MTVCLRGLCEFPMRWLNFGPLSFSLYLYSCSCYSVTVGLRRLLKSHGLTIQEVECTGWIQSCEVYSFYPHEVALLKKMHLSG